MIGNVLLVALEDKTTEEVDVIEVVVGVNKIVSKFNPTSSITALFMQDMVTFYNDYWHDP